MVSPASYSLPLLWVTSSSEAGITFFLLRSQKLAQSQEHSLISTYFLNTFSVVDTVPGREDGTVKRTEGLVTTTQQAKCDERAGDGEGGLLGADAHVGEWEAQARLSISVTCTQSPGSVRMQVPDPGRARQGLLVPQGTPTHLASAPRQWPVKCQLSSLWGQLLPLSWGTHTGAWNAICMVDLINSFFIQNQCFSGGRFINIRALYTVTD